MPDARGVELPIQRLQEFFTSLFSDARRPPAYSYPGFDERSHQPWPDGSLMIGAIALQNTSLITADVSWLAGSQGAEAERREKTFFDRVNHPPRPPSLEEWDG
jgi:hypothetical protein